jgi:hypothetical protein
MFSTRKSIRNGCVALLGLLMLAGGCQKKFQPDIAKLNDRPILIDNAMKQRRWNQTHVDYADGGTPAWSTGFKYESRPGHDWWMDQIFSPAVFIGQVIAMPVVLVSDYPNQIRTYRGVTVPPTWHAIPPLEPVQ